MATRMKPVPAPMDSEVLPRVGPFRDFAVEFGRDVSGELAAVEEREWLSTNGIGGFASGTVSGIATRRYHGLLMAALRPPLGRTLLVGGVDETVEMEGEAFPLAAHRWVGGSISPEGYKDIEHFRLEGTTPVWSFACADALLDRRIWMQSGANTTYVRYDLVRSSRPVNLAIKVLVNYRDYHSMTRARDWHMNVGVIPHGVVVRAFDGATPFYLLSAQASGEPAHEWYRNFEYAKEAYRGLETSEDQLLGAVFRGRLEPGSSLTLVFSTDPSPQLDGKAAYNLRIEHERSLLERASMWSRPAGEAPVWIRQLVLAADQFIVRRPLAGDPDALSVIAGYHWFGDWGRDTMIALPGLALATGRPDVARNILRTFARFTDQGMLPNVFPDAGTRPEYNTADAALWYFEAVRQYFDTTGDLDLVRELFPVLTEMVSWHVRGTRYRIQADPKDGLLFAGEPGVQLTWMDAKIGDWVVTPRIGKPIELSALWLNALATMGRFARALTKPSTEYDALAERTRKGFRRFWKEDAGYCYDVLDGPVGNDPALRPNQIFAVSLPESGLAPAQQRAVVDICARHLLTSHGLRSLAPGDPDYQGHYGGGPVERDSAYHQGTVWGWLLGLFVLAHLRVYNDPSLAASFLTPMAHHLNQQGLGTIGEIFDGDAPFTPRGCIAQAWSVAEILRAWLACRK